MRVFSLLIVLGICLVSFQVQAQSEAEPDINRSLKKRADGKYIYTLSGRALVPYKPKTYANHKLWVIANGIPVGSQVSIINTKDSITATAVVVDSIADTYYRYQPYYAAQISNELRKVLNFEQGEVNNAIISYETSLDKQLRQATKLPVAQQITAYKNIVVKFKHYHTPSLDQTPPVDSLRRILNRISPKQQEILCSFLAKQLLQGFPKSSIVFLKKALTIAQQQGNKNKEAEYWLRLGDTHNSAVNKIEANIKYGNHSKRMAQIAEIAKQSGFKVADLIRWSRYDNYFSNFYGSDQPRFVFDAPSTKPGYYPSNIRYYPDASQFSDKEYLEYLKIKKKQGSTDGIAWGLKKLGDLYRVKIGYAKAEAYYIQFLALRKQGKNEDKLAWAWAYLADFYWEQKQFGKTADYFNKIYKLRMTSKNYRGAIWALGGLRSLRYEQNKPSEALAYQRQIMALADKLKSKDPKWVLNIVIGNYLRVFSSQQKLILNYLVQWFKENNANKKLAAQTKEENNILSDNISRIAGYLGENKIAADHLVYQIEEAKGSVQQLKIINDVAFHYQQAKEYKLSKKYYRLGLKKAKLMQNRIYEAIQYYKTGYFYDAQSKTKKANKQYKAAVRTLKKIPNNQFDNNSLYYYLQQISRYFHEKREDKKLAVAFTEQFARITKSVYIEKVFRDYLKKIKGE